MNCGYGTFHTEFLLFFPFKLLMEYTLNLSVGKGPWIDASVQMAIKDEDRSVASHFRWSYFATLVVQFFLL